MFLNLKNDNIKYLALNRLFADRYLWKIDDKNKLKEASKSIHSILKFISIDERRNRDFYGVEELYRISFASGILCANSNYIDDVIKAKYNSNSFDEIKTVHFDSFCQFPRTKLRTFSDIKIVRDFQKADCTIIPKLQKKQNFVPTSGPFKINSDKHLIMYSPSEDTYYIINVTFNAEPINDFFKYIQEASNHKIKCGEQSLLDFAYQLRDCELMPNDIQIFYEGPIIYYHDEKLFNCTKRIVNEYKSIKFVDEINALVGKQLNELNKDSLLSLLNMLESDDSATVDLAMKLMCQFNIANRETILYMILVEYNNKLRSSKIFNSVDFKTLIKFIVGDKSWFPNFNFLMDKCTNQEEKDLCNVLINFIVKRQILKQVNGLKNKYSSFILDV